MVFYWNQILLVDIDERDRARIKLIANWKTVILLTVAGIFFFLSTMQRCNDASEMWWNNETKNRHAEMKPCDQIIPIGIWIGVILGAAKSILPTTTATKTLQFKGSDQWQNDWKWQKHSNYLRMAINVHCAHWMCKFNGISNIKYVSCNVRTLKMPFSIYYSCCGNCVLTTNMRDVYFEQNGKKKE